jgi:Toxin PAAR-like domain
VAELEGARKDGQFVVVCLSPCVCKTPPDDKPVQYQISAVFLDATRLSPDVNFHGQPAATTFTRLKQVTGNEAGSGGGVNSGVNLGYCRPIEDTASQTVRVNGYYALQDKKTRMDMNCNGPDGPGNTIGAICFRGTSLQASAGAGGGAAATDPGISAETPAEKGFLSGMGKKLLSADSIAALAQKLPSFISMDWSNPGAVLGAISGYAGMAQLGGLAQITGLANSVFNMSQADWSNPAAMFGALNLAGGLGGVAGGAFGQAARPLGQAAAIGGKATSVVQADFKNPGALMGVCMNLAGICQLAG